MGLMSFTKAAGERLFGKREAQRPTHWHEHKIFPGQMLRLPA
jgi:hypothetical protein